MTLQDAYEALKRAGTRDAGKDDQDLAGLADTRLWDVLKESLLLPKIAGLLAMAQDVASFMEGKETKEQFADKVIIARISAGHLQDIIDRVEQAKGVQDEQRQRAEQAGE